MTQQEANAIIHRIAKGWHAGLDLMIDGVDLGDVMTYDVLRVAGRMLKPADAVSDRLTVEENKGDGRTESGSSRQAG